MSRIEARIQALSREARYRRGFELGSALVLSAVFAEYARWFESDVMRASAATVVGCVLAVTVALMLLTRANPVAVGPGASSEALVAAWQTVLRRQARVYAWAPLWLVLPVLLAVCAFVLSLDRVVYASQSPSPMLPADLGIMVALGLAISVLNLEWSRRLNVAAATLDESVDPKPAAAPSAAPVEPAPAAAEA